MASSRQRPSSLTLDSLPSDDPTHISRHLDAKMLACLEMALALRNLGGKAMERIRLLVCCSPFCCQTHTALFYRSTFSLTSCTSCIAVGCLPLNPGSRSTDPPAARRFTTCWRCL